MMSTNEAGLLKITTPPNALHNGRSAALLRAGCENHDATCRSVRDRLATGDQLPAGVALRYVGVIARRVGAVVPHRGSRILARVVVAIVRIVAIDPATKPPEVISV